MQYLQCVYTKKSYKLFIWNSTLPEYSVFYVEILPLIRLWFLFWPWCVACRISVPWPGIKSVPPAVKALSPTHGPPRNSSSCDFLPVPPFPSLINKLNRIFVMYLSYRCLTVLCCAQSLQLCLTLHIPVGCIPPGSSVPGILQARILAWVTMSSSKRSSPPRDRTHVSCITDSLPLSHWVKPHESLSFPWKKSSRNSMPVVGRREIEK